MHAGYLPFISKSASIRVPPWKNDLPLIHLPNYPTIELPNYSLLDITEHLCYTVSRSPMTMAGRGDALTASPRRKSRGRFLRQKNDDHRFHRFLRFKR